MARTFLTNFDSQDRVASGISSASLPSGVSFDTSVKRATGLASLKFVPASGSGASAVSLNFTAGNDWRRFNLQFTVLPASTRMILGTTASGNIRITSSGNLAFYSSTTLVGTGTATLTDTNRIYAIDVRSSNVAESQVKVRVDGVDDITVTSNVQITSTVGCVDTVAATYTMYLHGVAVDGAAFPGPGEISLLLPISDNARAAKWVAGSNATTATTNLWEGVNNTPPVGTASSNAVTAAISHTGGGAGNEDYDANMTTYSTAGINSFDTVNAIQAVFAHGEDISTGTKTLTFGVKSNPAGSFETNFSAGGDSGACGTWPTTWTLTRGTVISTPSVTVGSSPVMTARRPSTDTRSADVCFMGMYVDYTAGVAPTQDPVDPMGMSGFFGL